MRIYVHLARGFKCGFPCAQLEPEIQGPGPSRTLPSYSNRSEAMSPCDDSESSESTIVVLTIARRLNLVLIDSEAIVISEAGRPFMGVLPSRFLSTIYILCELMSNADIIHHLERNGSAH